VLLFILQKGGVSILHLLILKRHHINKVSWMTSVTIIGVLASALTAIAAFPQLLKIIREKKAEDLSVLMLCVLITGLALWIYYGFMKEDYIIIVANCISAFIYILILILTIRYKQNTKSNQGKY
jgi:MtN3 and saliva related transmembrane protein